jgi:hypothetical protein
MKTITGIGIALLSLVFLNQLLTSDSETIAEGVVFWVEYKLEDGKTGGFTRLNLSSAVPGGNGSWNVDAFGRLTDNYLIITYPQKKDLGPLVIPSDQLVEVQFGDGGIKQLDENKPNLPK